MTRATLAIAVVASVLSPTNTSTNTPTRAIPVNIAGVRASTHRRELLGMPQQHAVSGYPLRVWATWYPAGVDGTYRTYTGVVAEHGVVAVDPAVIPLGTVLWIPGYGWAVAEDTGRDIVGRHIDLCFDTRVPWERAAATVWGERWITVMEVS